MITCNPVNNTLHSEHIKPFTDLTSSDGCTPCSQKAWGIRQAKQERCFFSSEIEHFFIKSG